MREVIEQIVAYPQGVDAATLSEVQRYAKLFWLNNGPYNNLTARKFVLKLTPEAFKAAVYASAKAGATLHDRPGNDRSEAGAPAADVLRSDRRSDRHQQDTRAPARTSCRPAPTISTPACRWRTSRASTRSTASIRASVKAERQARRRGLQDRRQVRQLHQRDRQAPRSREAVRRTADGQGARRARSSSIGPARKPIARPTTSRGCRTRSRRSTPSTASSRSTSIRAASRAAGKAWSSTSTRRRRSASRPSPPTRSGSRITCRGMPKYRKPSVQGIVANAIDVDRRDRRLRPGHAGRHQPAERSGDPREVRQQVGGAGQRQRGLRQVRARQHAQRVLVGAGRGGALAEVRHLQRRADDRHARGDRPRVGPAGRGQGATRRR